jgi:acetoin utilization deacetylase AcuC-like enzyme
LVTQLGVDTHCRDLLRALLLTTQGYVAKDLAVLKVRTKDVWQWQEEASV